MSSELMYFIFHTLPDKSKLSVHIQTKKENLISRCLYIA